MRQGRKEGIGGSRDGVCGCAVVHIFLNLRLDVAENRRRAADALQIVAFSLGQGGVIIKAANYKDHSITIKISYLLFANSFCNFRFPPQRENILLLFNNRQNGNILHTHKPFKRKQ